MCKIKIYLTYLGNENAISVEIKKHKYKKPIVWSNPSENPAIMHFMSPMAFYESHGLLWVPWPFMSPMTFYESQPVFMSPIKFLRNQLEKRN